MWPYPQENLQETANLVTITKEIPNGKLYEQWLVIGSF